MDIENLKKIIALPIELGNIGDAIGAADPKDWKRWFKIIDALDELINLFTVNWSEVKLELEALVYDKIGENEGLQTDSWKVSWKQQNSPGFKSEKFKEEEPEIYRKYTVKIPILDKKLLQQEQQEVYARYKTKTRVLRPRRIKK